MAACRLAAASLVAIAVTACSTAVAEEWSRFRGPHGRGVVSADLPTVWSESENLAWKTSLPGKGSSSPVIWKDRVYLTAYTGYGLEVEDPGDRSALMLHVLCLSLRDGRLIWDCPVKPSPQEQPMGKRIGEHGYASPTPCVDDSGVYAFFGPSGLVAVSLEGEVRWRRELGQRTVGFGAAASPILYGDLVIQNASIESGKLYALDKQTGQTRWQAEGIRRAWTTPTVITRDEGVDELIVNQKNAILAFDPVTGQALWTCDAIQDYVVPCVIEQDGVLYCSGGRSNKTFAVRPGGRGDVSESHLVWDRSRGANVTSPLLVDGLLFWSHDKAIVLCLRASDGEQVFRERMPTRSRVYASIVSDGEKLYLATRDAGVLVLAATAEYNELAINRLGGPDERFNATPAITGNRLLLRSDTHLYCVKRTPSDSSPHLNGPRP